MYPRLVTFYNEQEIYQEMKKIGVHNTGIKIMLPKGRFFTIKIKDVPLKAAIILKQEMLSKGGEAVLPSGVSTLSIEKAAIILLGTEVQFKNIIKGLYRQPFKLKELAGRLEQLFDNLSCGQAAPEERKRTLKLGNFSIPLGKRTIIMGILNVTPDSFSDGGKFLTKDHALRQVEKMQQEGADIIDVGGESTRPGSVMITEEEEIARVIPIIEALSARIQLPVSIDTYKSKVAKEAIEAGAVLVNDVWGLKKDSHMAATIAHYGLPVCLMHNRKIAQYQDLISDIIADLQESIDIALEAGIREDNIIIDPGIGFAKISAESLEVLRRLEEFRTFGYPILLGTSRKSMIGKTLGGVPVEERVEGTAATIAYGITRGVDIVRVHDVLAMARVAKMTDALVRGGKVLD